MFAGAGAERQGIKHRQRGERLVQRNLHFDDCCAVTGDRHKEIINQVADLDRFYEETRIAYRFVYEVRLRSYIQPTFALAVLGDEKKEENRYYRDEGHLKEGGQDYDVMSWPQEQIINDILDQYEKHLHFLHLVR